MSRHYRPEIDGLRAIAVAGVVLDHVGLALFHAGFAGVDIFFVISGFLIGGIVTGELAEGRFSFRSFYARRVRRILPALFVMILITLPFALWLMTPQDLRYFGGGAVTAVLSLSNVWFLNRIDYFDPAALHDPLLHTWSLAVEEQFYMVFPIVMLILWRFGRAVVWRGLAVVALASFAYTLLYAARWPMAGFYLGHTRAWELLAGVLAAQAMPRLGQIAPQAQQRMASLGVVMVLASITLIPAGVAWPGVWTLLPVGGALLIVAFGGAGGAGARLLSSRPFVGLGVISYSAYLWHQPILGFLYQAGHPVETPLAMAGVIAATLGLAYLSWRFVEQPFRRPSPRPWPKRALLIGLALLILGFGIGGHVTKGYPARLPPDVLALLDAHGPAPRHVSCIGGAHAFGEVQADTACVFGADVPAQVALWGDSHAMVLVDGLARGLAAKGMALRELTLAGCSPIVGLNSADMQMYPFCADHNRRMFDYLLADKTIKVVILHAYWNYGFQRVDYDNGAGGVATDYAYLTVAGAPPDLADAARWEGIQAALEAEITALQAAGKRVLLIGPVPQPGVNVVTEAVNRRWREGAAPQEITIPETNAAAYSAPAITVLSGAAAKTGAGFYDPSPLFCTTGARCYLRKDGVSLYFDDNHLSPPAAEWVVGAILPAITAAP